MASNNDTSSGEAIDVLNELEYLKEKYGPKCRVIKNVGDFQNIVTIKRNTSDLAYKFQLYGNYPATSPHISIKSSQLVDEDRHRLSHFLTQKAANTKMPIIDKLVNAADAWIKAENFTYVIEAEESSSKSSPRHKKQKKRPRRLEEEVVNEKKSSMKTAEDVIKRIQWDSNIPSESMTVAYLDRFIGIVEKNFSAFTWEDLASVDYEDLAIPQHRIQYFKYKNEKVWDKNKRMDNVFGSTGSGKTIIDVIASYEEKPKEEAVSEEYESEDVEINTGFSNDVEVGTEAPLAKDGEEAEPATGTIRARETYWGVKSRPTHFLCLRVTDPEIQKAVTEVQDVIRELEPGFEQSFIHPERLHITIACVGLDNYDRVNEATELLYKLQPELQKLDPQNIKVELEGTDNFFHNVLYAKVKPNQGFMTFADHVRSVLSEGGIEVRDVFDFNPHMTLLKFKKGTQIEMKTRTALDARIYSAVEGKVFGSQSVNNLYLCEMGENRDVNGFYICPAIMDFHGDMEEDTNW